MTWRLLPTRRDTSYVQMALDETMLESAARNGKAALRFYTWSVPAVAIGYFQRVMECVHVERCAGVELFRRLTGGGCVYKDPRGELNYALALPPGHPLLEKEVLETYRVICGALIDALSILGVEATFKPVNDILIEGRKVSGNAQTRMYGGLLMHGTLLLDFDAERMATLLKSASEEALRERVTTLREQGVNATQEGVEHALLEGFRALAGGFEKEAWSEEEEARAGRLEQKYASPAWIQKR